MTRADPNDRFVDITPSAEDGAPPISGAAFGERRKRGRWVLLGLVALGGAVLAGLAMTGGRAVDPNAPVPTIRADDAPVKVRPDQPGGMEVPNQDKLIYGRLGNQGQPKPGQVERLLPPPEVPLPPPAPAPAERAMVAEEPTTPEPPPPPGQIRNAAPGPKPAEPPPQAAPPLPVQTVTPAVKVVPPQAASAAKPAAAAPQQAALPSAKGAFLIQLGALKEEKQVEAEWGRLKKANEDLLGGLTSDVMRADLGAKGVYFRLRAGPLSSEAAARDLCAKLAQRKTGCIVVRP